MTVVIGYNSRIGVTGSILHERYNDRSGRLRDFEIAQSMECTDAKISYQHQKG